jgi:hypothetical protein
LGERKYGKNVFNVFYLNIYIIPIVIIYEFVVLWFIAKTAKDIAKLIKQTLVLNFNYKKL